MQSEENERRIIADGLAVIATSVFEMGNSRDEARRAILAMWERVGAPQGALHDALEALKHLPQPLSESPEEIERKRPIREYLGVQSADEQLVAALAATELLRDLAAQYD